MTTTPTRRGPRELPAASEGVAQPAPPVKPPTWEPYIPAYFWLGGLSAGAWLAAAAEDVAGESDRGLIGTARYLAAGGLLAGTALLIADLGRPDRFHHMLRIVRVRSAMSLGSWGLALYGGFVGAGALLQAAEDGLLGPQPTLVRWSAGLPGRALHLAGLPAALFVGGYTGVLLASTSTPSWARRAGLLGPLFLASGASSGMAGVAVLLERRDRRLGQARQRRRALRRLARAESIALAAELALSVRSEQVADGLPSGRQRQLRDRVLRAAMLAGGMLLPLALAGGRRARPGLLGAALTLAGSLALRVVTTREGYASARTAEDTWRHTARRAPHEG